MFDKFKNHKALVATGFSAIALASTLSLNGCASCSRFTKSLGSEIDGGIWRKIDVYSDGELVAQYVGFFDIQVDESGRILFDDENGKRHQIGGGDTGYVIDELSESEAKELQKENKTKTFEKTIIK